MAGGMLEFVWACWLWVVCRGGKVAGSPWGSARGLSRCQDAWHLLGGRPACCRRQCQGIQAQEQYVDNIDCVPGGLSSNNRGC